MKIRVASTCIDITKSRKPQLALSFPWTLSYTFRSCTPCLPMPSSATQPTSQNALDELMKCLSSSFAARPFKAKLGSSQQAQIIDRLGTLSTVDFEGRLTTELQTAGREWALARLKKLSPSSVPTGAVLRKIQTDLLKALHQSLTSKALSPLFSTRDEETVAIYIKQTDSFVTNAIEKAKKQSYSIAFCGMVKAGYVITGSVSAFFHPLAQEITIPQRSHRSHRPTNRR